MFAYFNEHFIADLVDYLVTRNWSNSDVNVIGVSDIVFFYDDDEQQFFQKKFWGPG